MSAAVISRYYTRCPECGDWIKPGDPIVFVSDTATHEECEQHPAGWDADAHLPPEIAKLKSLLDKRGTLIQAAFAAELLPHNLPERISAAFDQAMAAEGTLQSLCEDVASEHREEVV